MSSKKTYTHVILEYLSTYPGASIKDISMSTGLSHLIVRKILYKLKNDNYVERSGNGYILTQRGQDLLNYISSKSPTPSEGKIKDKEMVGERGETSITENELVEERKTEASARKEVTSESLVPKMEAIERKLAKLEKDIEELKKALSGLAEIKRENKPLSSPVMTYSDAQSLLGNLFERMLYEGRIVRVGRLVVEKTFIDEFKKKFPLRVSDIEKLTDPEKILLEEMRREALVILYAGRELRLVER